MDIICKNCGYKCSTNKVERCPRCHAIISIPKKCEDCQGCSLFTKGCNVEDRQE